MSNPDLNLMIFCAVSGKTWHEMVADFTHLKIRYDSFCPIKDPMEVIIHDPKWDTIPSIQSLGWTVTKMKETIAARQIREIKACVVVA